MIPLKQQQDFTIIHWGYPHDETEASKSWGPHGKTMGKPIGKL